MVSVIGFCCNPKYYLQYKFSSGSSVVLQKLLWRSLDFLKTAQAADTSSLVASK